MFKLIDKIWHSQETNAPKGMGLACNTFVDKYLTMLDRPFLKIFLKLRSKVKVTVTQKQNVTLDEPKKHPYTKHEICSRQDYSRTEVNVTVTQPNIKFGGPTSNSPDMIILEQRSRSQ